MKASISEGNIGLEVIQFPCTLWSLFQKRSSSLLNTRYNNQEKNIAGRCLHTTFVRACASPQVCDDRVPAHNSKYSDTRGECRESSNESRVIAPQEIRLRLCRDKQALKRAEKSYHFINLVLDASCFLLAFVNPIFQRRTKVAKFFKRYFPHIDFCGLQPDYLRQSPNRPLNISHLTLTSFDFLCITCVI